MQISSSQMKALESAMVATFARRLATYFESECGFERSHDGTPFPHGAALLEAVRALIGTARSFGLESETAVGQFVLVGLAYSRSFHLDARVVEMLRSPQGSPDQNMQRVLNAVIVAEERGA